MENQHPHEIVDKRIAVKKETYADGSASVSIDMPLKDLDWLNDLSQSRDKMTYGELIGYDPEAAYELARRAILVSWTAPGTCYTDFEVDNTVLLHDQDHIDGLGDDSLSLAAETVFNRLLPHRDEVPANFKVELNAQPSEEDRELFGDDLPAMSIHQIHLMRESSIT